jgi:hypothetical protein
MALTLLIVFVAISAAVAAGIGAAIAGGTTIGVIAALFVHLIGTIAVLGVTFGALGPDGAD